MRSHRNLRKRDFLAGFDAGVEYGKRVEHFARSLEAFVDSYNKLDSDARREYNIRYKAEMDTLKRWLAS